jgi:uncharacterized protein (DUF2062 family)
LAKRVFHRHLWRPERHATSLGLAIGLAVAMLPVPLQMLAAASLAVWCSANIPFAAAAVWVSNPATWGFIIPFQRNLGRKLFPTQDGVYDVGIIGFESARSMTVGVIVTAAVLGLVGYVTLYLIWGLFSPSTSQPTSDEGGDEDD